MKNPIAVIGIDTHEGGSVWVSVGRKMRSGATGNLDARTEYCAFKNYPCFGSTERQYRFMRRAQWAQAQLMGMGDQWLKERGR